MQAKVHKFKLGACRRPVIVLPALVVALSLVFAGAASAQSAFQANVTFTGTLPSGFCSDGAFFCGTANIAGYGPATWNLYVTSNNNVQSPCGSTYTALTYFTLASDGSTLALNEGGDLCGLGHDGAAYRGYFTPGSKDFGHPYSVVGSWTTDTNCSTIPPPGEPSCSTGQFAGLIGSGTDTLQVAGAHIAGSYTGTLG